MVLGGRCQDPDMRRDPWVLSIPLRVTLEQMKIGPIPNPGPRERGDKTWRKQLFDDLLRGVRLQSSVYFRPAFRAPWGVRVARDCGVFHIIDQGRCWLDAASLGKSVELSEGDFVVITRGQPHSMRDQLSTPVVNFFELAQKHASEPQEAIWLGGDGDVTRMICGGMVFENSDCNPLLAVLPPLLHLRRSRGRRSPDFATGHMIAELDGPRAGTLEVVTRLADILFIQAVRAYFEENMDRAESGWLVAARDEQIGRALAILHSHPHLPWTVASLAQQVGLSRSTFAARFSELVGEPPQHYFTRIRINSAATLMRRTRDKLSLVAAEAGYSSVTAFSKAFKRFLGTTPGEHRASRKR